MNDWYDAEQRVERAEELFEQRRWQEALDELRAAVAIDPDNSTWLYNMGLTLDEMERYDEAIDVYKRALAIEPEDVATLSRLGEDQYRAGRPQQALESFQRVEKIDSSHEPCYCPRIGIYAELGDHEKAEEMFYLARLYKDSCACCYYNIGCSLSARGLYDKAVDCWRRSLEMEDADPRAHLRIAEAMRHKLRLAEARRHYLEALRQDPGNIEILLDMGDLLVEMGQNDEAGEKYRRAIELVPDDAAGHFSYGKWLVRQGRRREAAGCLKRALQLDPTCPEANLLLGRLCAQRKDRGRATRYLEAELRLQPEDARVLAELVEAMMDSELWASAAVAAGLLLKIDPANIAARLNLAVALFRQGHDERGIAACLGITHLMRGHPEATYDLALGYMRLGQYRRALRRIDRARRDHPDDADLSHLRLRIRLILLWRSIKRFWKKPAKS